MEKLRDNYNELDVPRASPHIMELGANIGDKNIKQSSQASTNPLAGFRAQSLAILKKNITLQKKQLGTNICQVTRLFMEIIKENRY